MEKAEWKIDYTIFENSYPEEYEELCRWALEATRRAYDRYSHFSVGAAVLMNNGEVVLGSNQENEAYPSGMCAERTALFYACSQFPEVGVKALAIAARKDGEVLADFITPCGACRQVMAEIVRRYGQDFDVLLVGGKRSMRVKAGDLLPFVFRMGD